MELRQLRTLVSILDNGGFAAAGDVIGLTQSAISLQIKALENELGTVLFDRTKRPPEPNAKAMTLAKQAREILRLCLDLGNFSENSLTGILKLGAIPSVQHYILPRALRALQLSHPDVFISITSGLSDELMRSVYRGALDAAIVSEPTKLSPGLSWHPFIAESLVVISTKECKGETAKEILTSNPYIRFIRGSWAGQLIGTKLNDLEIRVNTVVETDCLESVWAMVSCGMGVSVVPKHHIDTNISTHADVTADNSSDTPDNNSDNNPDPDNIIITSLGSETVELVTGLVERTSDPKSHLTRVLYESLAQLKLSGS